MINKYSKHELVAIYLGLACLLVFLLAPFAEAFFVSLRRLEDVFQVPYSLLSENMGVEAYVTMWTSVPNLLRYILNSFFIALSVTLLALLCIVPAAYAFARFEFRMRDGFLTAFLAINMIGAAVLIIPLYRLMMATGLLNTYFAMIIPGAAFCVPTGILLLRTYFLRIPRDLEEAAYVDGASRVLTMRRIILPLAMPGIVVVAITTFVTAYAQQFLFALTFNAIDDFAPLPVGLFKFFGQQHVAWNELMAASIVGTLPVLLVFFFLQRYLVAGLTSGAVKE
ncbi:carbohydrate ABC transporter permease [Celeribacter indicus]|uniref:Maltose ABC transporter transmembrane protein n=1 Tax=Celeribacter indicus TaxID=1208324 RepID=A0A0B5E6U5_9RHOB|nr:carbohydrate ABC transporter permease [Celeribacter indicus]AJE48716.1 maltose ABC transporter transmembrane protein [Celeribacter indicus]SDX12255.1 carbohydrate ABC transporter membrane protein 2, CUT1 family [Celeribacter indicus]